MEIRKLTESDFETGMIFEQRLVEAHKAFEAANAVYLAYMDILRQRYNAPEGQYALKDWAVGFEATNGE